MYKNIIYSFFPFLFFNPNLVLGDNQMKSALIRSDYASGEVTRLCQSAIEVASKKLDELVKIPLKNRTVNNTLLAFEKITADLNDQATPLTFMSYVSPSKTISAEAAACEESLNRFMVGVSTRKDIYEAVKDQKNLNTQQNRLFSETMKSFEENGLKLPDDKLKQAKELKEALTTLETQFNTLLNQDDSFLEFTATELRGLPEDFLNSLQKTKENKFIVTTKEPHYIRVIENALLEKTRQQMLNAFENRVAKKNTQLLEEAILLRQKIAHVIGYSTWADYKVHNRMTQNSKTVLDFLNGLRTKLAQRNQADLKILLKFKQELDPSASAVHAWDITYLSYQLKKRDYHLDQEKIREFFPADRVITGLFKIYSKLLGIEFIEIKNSPVWDPSVKLYQVKDKKNKQTIGYFYTDFIPRAGKYGHAAAFTLRAGRQLENGNYSQPISSIVANFTPAEGSKPVLLNHDEVETLFHEFGHIMHQTLTQAPYASLSGSNVDQDFVEAPSQMLENWVYSRKILTSLSGHYLDPTKKLPPQFIQQILDTRDFNQGYFYTRQLLLALFDMICHTTHGPVDTTLLYQKLHIEILGIPSIEGGHMPASFGHLMGGYDAGYYGYLWSKIYSEDMFTRFEKEGLLNEQVGADYRKIVLESGKMIDSFKILHKFLGRKPNNDAFYNRLHVNE